MPQQQKNGARPRPQPKDAPAREAQRKKKRKKQPLSDDEIDWDYERSVKFANRGCAVTFLAILLVAGGIALALVNYVFNELAGKEAKATGTVTVDIPYGAGGTTVANVLLENGLISNDNIFKFYVRFNGAGAAFQSGRFQLEAGMSYDEIIEVLSEKKATRLTEMVTIPPGSTLIQFGEILEKEGICSAQEFIDEANNGDYSDIKFWNYINTQPNTFMKAEGYLAPDTYEFYVDDAPANVVRKLYEQFDKNISSLSFYTEEGIKDFYEMLEYKNLGLREVITMASIIEEEASKNDENQSMVSGVFWNRMLKDHPSGELARRTLGTDVTTRYLADFVIRDYASPDYTGWTLADMKIDMLNYIPHNLFYAYYTGDEDAESVAGLPAGPISCPDIPAIRAALEPAVHDYFYFVTGTGGNYKFWYATYYNQHLQNIELAHQSDAQFQQEQAAASAAEGDGDA